MCDNISFSPLGFSPYNMTLYPPAKLEEAQQESKVKKKISGSKAEEKKLSVDSRLHFIICSA